jgi:hypothetical protein
MSIPSNSDGGGAAAKVVKGGAAVAAVVALVFGAKAIAGGDATTEAAGAAGTQPGQPFTGAGAYGAPGGPRRGMGFGPQVTGDTLSKLKHAVAARYPGTVEHAMKLPDGSYVVDVIRSGGTEVHVHVSQDFHVLGAEPGRPHMGGPHLGGPPPGTPS